MDIKTKIMIFSLGLVAIFGTSCRWGTKEVEKETQERLVLVNVLDKKFFDDSRIAGSINVTMDNLEEYAKKNWDKEKTNIVVYCANYKCTASGESAKILKDLGFKHVWAYEGGTAEWNQLGYPIEGPAKQGYLKDYQKPEGHTPEAGVPVISADELKAKIEQFGSK